MLLVAFCVLFQALFLDQTFYNSLRKKEEDWGPLLPLPLPVPIDLPCVPAHGTCGLVHPVYTIAYFF